MIVMLLTEHHMVFLSLNGGCTGKSESTLVKMPHCWKSHFTAQFIMHMRIGYLSHYERIPLNVHASVSRGARFLILGLSLVLLENFLYARSEGPDETAHMRRLV